MGAVGVAVALVGVSSPAGTGQALASTNGIVMVRGGSHGDPVVGETSDALGLLQELAASDVDRYGYAWFSQSAKLLTLDVVGTAESSARAKARELKQAIADRYGLGVELRTVTTSQHELERIKDEAIELVRDPRFDEAQIHLTRVDHELHRVVVVASRSLDSLSAELTASYGGKIAFQVEERGPSHAQSRQADFSPFYGGAAINGGGCTVGFPWRSNDSTKHMMVTAGHCKPNGGSITVPAYQMGTVEATEEENWNPTSGTTLLPGESRYRGDLALVRITGGHLSGFNIFVGGPDSNSSRVVGAIWSRAPEPEDQFCISGNKSGETCGWTVRWAGVNVAYGDAIVRNTNESWPELGICTKGGDSGAPVYTVRTDGKVVAKGIFSGGGTGALGKCWVNFTDIREAKQGFPGTLKTA